jgi:hypothetical protein
MSASHAALYLIVLLMLVGGLIAIILMRKNRPRG